MAPEPFVQTEAHHVLAVVHELLARFGLKEPLLGISASLLLAALVGLVAWLCGRLGHSLLIRVIKRLVQKTETRWDDAFLEAKVFLRAAALIPAVIVYVSAPLFPLAEGWIQRLAHVWLLAIALLIVNAVLDAADTIYRQYDLSRRKPIKGYLEVAKIVASIIIGIIVLGTVMDRSPWTILTGLGAMTAILMLVFKDSILGFVAGIQLSANDMVRVGDWIEMPSHNTDGDVIDISLHTVKVQNWDKTISTIPTHALISNSFRNWRGMSESGGRRIKRSLNLDMNSVRFCTDAELDQYERIDCLAEYVRTRRKEVAAHNEEAASDLSVRVNGRRLTNIGTFRKYVEEYLRTLPDIHKDMTFLVRQLAPGSHGLPIEIYVFSSDQVWKTYEGIQADIFDHLLAVLPDFGLRVFQNPAGVDFQRLGESAQGDGNVVSDKVR